MRIKFKFTETQSIEIDAAQLFKTEVKFTEATVSDAIVDALRYRNGLLWYNSNFALGVIINLNLVRTIRIIK